MRALPLWNCLTPPNNDSPSLIAGMSNLFSSCAKSMCAYNATHPPSGPPPIHGCRTPPHVPHPCTCACTPRSSTPHTCTCDSRACARLPLPRYACMHVSCLDMGMIFFIQPLYQISTLIYCKMWNTIVPMVLLVTLSGGILPV